MDDPRHIYFRLHDVTNHQATTAFSRYWVMAHATRLVCDGQLCYDVPFGNWDDELAGRTDYNAVWVLNEKGKWKEAPINLEVDEWSKTTPHGAGIYYLAKGNCAETWTTVEKLVFSQWYIIMNVLRPQDIFFPLCLAGIQLTSFIPVPVAKLFYASKTMITENSKHEVQRDHASLEKDLRELFVHKADLLYNFVHENKALKAAYLGKFKSCLKMFHIFLMLAHLSSQS